MNNGASRHGARGGGTSGGRLGEPTDASGTRCAVVRLVRGGHEWRFCCDAAGLRPMIRRLAELAADEAAPLDWFDAAVTAQELTERCGSAARPGDATAAE